MKMHITRIFWTFWIKNQELVRILEKSRLISLGSHPSVVLLKFKLSDTRAIPSFELPHKNLRIMRSIIRTGLTRFQLPRFCFPPVWAGSSYFAFWRRGPMMRVMIVVSSHVCSVCAMKAQILGRRDDCFFLCPLCGQHGAKCRCRYTLHVASLRREMLEVRSETLENREPYRTPYVRKRTGRSKIPTPPYTSTPCSRCRDREVFAVWGLVHDSWLA